MKQTTYSRFMVCKQAEKIDIIWPLLSRYFNKIYQQSMLWNILYDNELADLSWFSHHLSPGVCELESAVISRHFVADSFLQQYLPTYILAKCKNVFILYCKSVFCEHLYINMLPNSFFGYLLKIRIGWKLN